jgi:hypothetical protein
MQSFGGKLLVACCALTLVLISSRESSAQCGRGGAGGSPGGRQLMGRPRSGRMGRPSLLRTPGSPLLQQQLLLIALRQRMLQGLPTQGQQQPGLFLQQKNQILLGLLDKLATQDDAVIARALRSSNPYLRKAAAIEKARRKRAEKPRDAELDAR